MQLIANGPDIPAAVLHSQEEGKLVFFCGAGISMPSGLPSFKRLVEDVRDQLGAAFTPQEKREFDAEAYDRVLGMFESDARFGIKARQKVVKRLATVDNPQLGVHPTLKSEVLRLIDRGQVPREFAEAWRLIASFRGAADDIEFFRLPEIVDLVSELIGVIEHGDMVLGELEKELATLHPEKALILVDRITPDAPTPWFGDLKGTLQRIAEAAPELVGNPRYVRLLEISTKAGI